MAGRNYRDLTVWKKAMDLVLGIYRASSYWPRDESFGLTNQVRRAAVSIPANIAEGQGRDNVKEFLRFLNIARGSLYEVETHLLIASQLDYLAPNNAAPLMEQAAEIGRLVNGLTASLRSRIEN